MFSGGWWRAGLEGVAGQTVDYYIATLANMTTKFKLDFVQQKMLTIYRVIYCKQQAIYRRDSCCMLHHTYSVIHIIVITHLESTTLICLFTVQLLQTYAASIWYSFRVTITYFGKFKDVMWL